MICLKCLEKDPRRRYASAEALAEDLQRYLSGEPIMARAVGRVERLRLWVFRNPTAAALAGTSLVALIAMIAASFFIAYNRELRRANRVIAESQAKLQTAYASEASSRKRSGGSRNDRFGATRGRSGSFRRSRKLRSTWQAPSSRQCRSQTNNCWRQRR